MNARPCRHKSGFSIVELLIVIVVIAILVSLSFVVYSTIQSRAERALVQSESRSIVRKLETFAAEVGEYPVSISDCPAPQPSNLCLATPKDTVVTYDNGAGAGGYAGRRLGPAYHLGLTAQNQFLYVGEGEREGLNEFLQYVDLAPYIDRYGLRKYRLSFDIKSTDASRQSMMYVYFQNGSGAKYYIDTSPRAVAVGEEYANRVIEFTPGLATASDTRAILAFYGVYGTGNRPVVKNVRFELAD